MSTADQYGANKAARARARIAEEGAAAVPLLEPLFPYTVVAPPIQYFRQFVKNDDPPTDDLPPMGW